MDTVIDDVNYISKISHALEKHLVSSGGQSSNESISSLDEDSWFERSTVEIDFKDTRPPVPAHHRRRHSHSQTHHRGHSSGQGHRRNLSADTWVNGFQYQSESSLLPPSHSANSSSSYGPESDSGLSENELTQEQVQPVASTPMRYGQFAYVKSQMSPSQMVPMQMQSQFVSYQLPPSMMTHQLSNIPSSPVYIYPHQPVYQPIYLSSQPTGMHPSTLLFPTVQQMPGSYCFSPSAPQMQSQGNAHIGVAYESMDYGSYGQISTPMPMQMPMGQPQVYIPVPCGYSPSGQST